MKKFVLICAFVCGMMAAPAFAQSSCSKPVLTGTINITTPTFLFAIEVPVGQPTPAGFNVTVDGVKQDQGSLPPELGSVICFPAQVTVTGNGNHPVTTSFYTLNGSGAKQESPQSTPFVLSLGSPAPTAAPINHQR